MTSDRQVNANRENAGKSTGPRTAEGKARSRFNAVKHGAYRVEPDEDEEELEVVQDVFEALDPQNAFQESLASEIGNAFVSLRRLSRFEASVLKRAERVGTEKFALKYGRSVDRIDADIEILRRAQSFLEHGEASEYAYTFSREWCALALRHVAEQLQNVYAGRRLAVSEERPDPEWLKPCSSIDGFVAQLTKALGGSRQSALKQMEELFGRSYRMIGDAFMEVDQDTSAESLASLGRTFDARERTVRTLDRLTRLFESCARDAPSEDE